MFFSVGTRNDANGLSQLRSRTAHFSAQTCTELICYVDGLEEPLATGPQPLALAPSHAVLRSERETPLRASSSAEHLQRLEARVLELERSLPANHPQACPSRKTRQ